MWPSIAQGKHRLLPTTIPGRVLPIAVSLVWLSLILGWREARRDDYSDWMVGAAIVFMVSLTSGFVAGILVAFDRTERSVVALLSLCLWLAAMLALMVRS
jgi:hypothetical protein